jgi:hypothetical protein
VRKAAAIALVALTGVLAARQAEARRRPLFEPTDLEMEEAGKVELDLQFGALRGEDAWRAAIPDAEIDVGLTPGVELDIDGTYAIEGGSDGQLTIDHAGPTDLWVCAKLGLYDDADDDRPDAGWAIGAQLGPKLPVARDAYGIGYEGLLLVGRRWDGDSHVVLNLGGLVDPGTAVGSGRPIGIEGGVDVSVQLRGTSFSLSGELGGVRFFSADAHQLHATAGVAWATTEAFEVSIVGLVGLLPGGDRGGVLLGVSPKFALWK